jgi:hypothetical protein
MLRSILSALSYHSFSLRLTILLSIVVIAILGVISLPSISHDLTHHRFADCRTILTIPNGNNVLSNVFLCISGILGFRRFSLFANGPAVFRWRFFFISITFAGLGSAYYHWLPTNNSLFWDRLPMTLGFAALSASLFAERFGERIGQVLFVPFVFLSTVGIVYWWSTEQLGLGDLRPYLLAQYLPLLLTPVLLIFFPKGYCRDYPYWILFLGYTIATGFEWKDFAVYEWTYQIISGHTLKHIVTALVILTFRPYAGDFTSLKELSEARV